MAEFDGFTHFLKAAVRRLEDAKELLQPPSRNPNRGDAEFRHTTGAVYLAGYAVEGVLKAYLLRYYGFQSVAEAQQKGSASLRAQFAHLNTTKGHNLLFLLRLTDLEKRMETYQRMKINWGICRKWTPILR